MKKLLSIIFAITLTAINAQAAELKVKIDGIETDKPIPEKFARCIATPTNKSDEGQNISPEITWDKGPEGTKAYAVVVVDRDVPLDLSNMNKDGKSIDQYAPRQNFYHWLLVNVPENIVSIPESRGRDKAFGDQLVNDFLKFMNIKPTDQNKIKFSGYDGPCPPWNDERMHHYHFKVYALSTRFTLADEYTGDEIVHKISPYVLATGEVVGTYTLNPMLNPAIAFKPAKPEIKPTITTNGTKKK